MEVEVVFVGGKLFCGYFFINCVEMLVMVSLVIKNDCVIDYCMICYDMNNGVCG